MKIIENPKKLERNRRIGLYISLAGLGILIGGFILSLPSWRFGQDGAGAATVNAVSPEKLALAYGALLVGLMLSQLGIYYSKRWLNAARVDEHLNQALKGLDESYTLYHHITAVPHLLVGPRGLWVLVPQHHTGTITFENNRFRQKGGSIRSRFFGQNGIGRPDLEAQSLKHALEKFLQKSNPEGKLPLILPLIFFVNPDTRVQIDGSPIPALSINTLKDFICNEDQHAPHSSVQPVMDMLTPESFS